jgi:hypothetical protein
MGAGMRFVCCDDGDDGDDKTAVKRCRRGMRRGPENRSDPHALETRRRFRLQAQRVGCEGIPGEALASQHCPPPVHAAPDLQRILARRLATPEGFGLGLAWVWPGFGDSISCRSHGVFYFRYPWQVRLRRDF